MKTMCPHSYDHNGFVVPDAWFIMYPVHQVPRCMNCHKVTVVITGRACCFDGCMYIKPILPM